MQDNAKYTLKKYNKIIPDSILKFSRSELVFSNQLNIYVCTHSNTSLHQNFLRVGMHVL